jgi:hypothetical protein
MGSAKWKRLTDPRILAVAASKRKIFEIPLASY